MPSIDEREDNRLITAIPNNYELIRPKDTPVGVLTRAPLTAPSTIRRFNVASDARIGAERPYVWRDVLMSYEKVTNWTSMRLLATGLASRPNGQTRVS